MATDSVEVMSSTEEGRRKRISERTEKNKTAFGEETSGTVSYPFRTATDHSPHTTEPMNINFCIGYFHDRIL